MPESKEPPAPRWNKSILVTAVVLAVIAVIIVNVWLDAERRRQRRGYMTVEVATRRLEKGQNLAKADVREAEMPPVSPQEAQRYIRTEQLAAVLDKPLARSVEANQRLQWDDFTSTAGSVGPEVVPPPDKGKPPARALTIPIDRTTSPGSLLSQGTYVDLLATLPATQSRNQAETITLLERVLVLAVGGKTLYDNPEQRGSYLSVTIQVTSEQAEKILTIKNYLKEGFTVILRNSADTKVSGKDGLDAALKTLGFAASAPAPPAE